MPKQSRTKILINEALEIFESLSRAQDSAYNIGLSTWSVKYSGVKPTRTLNGKDAEFDLKLTVLEFDFVKGLVQHMLQDLKLSLVVDPANNWTVTE